MKLILWFFCAGAFFASNGFAQTHSMTLKCKAKLMEIDGRSVALNKDIKFIWSEGQLIDNGFLELALGSVTLHAILSSYGGGGSNQIQPHFEMRLFKTHEGPLTGRINYSAAEGLDLKNRTASIPLILSGYNFLEITYEEEKYSRVDYSCELNKIN